MPDIALRIPVIAGLPPHHAPFEFTLSPSGEGGVLTIPIVPRGPESFAVSAAQEAWVSAHFAGLEMCFAGAWRTGDAAVWAQVAADLCGRAGGPPYAVRALLEELRVRYVANPPRAPNGRPLWAAGADVDDATRQAARSADLADFDRVLQAAPQHAEAWQLRGLRRMREHDDYVGALQDLNHAVELAPTSWRARTDRAAVHLALEQLAEARSDAQRGVELLDRDAPPAAAMEAKVFLAQILKKQGALQEAVELLKRAAPPHRAKSGQPGDYGAHRVRAECLRELGDAQGALAAWQCAALCVPDSSWPLQQCAQILWTQGDLAQALEFATRACAKEQPPGLDVLLLRGGLLRALDQPKKALPFLQKASELAPDDLCVKGELGVVLAKLARWHEALPLLDLYRAQVTWLPALLAHAECRWRLLDDAGGALQDLNEILETQPDFPGAAALVDEILLGRVRS